MTEFNELNERCRAVLAGHMPDIQAAVLADLLACWLAGWQGDNAARLREEMLALHIKAVRALIPVNEAEIQAKRR